MKTPQWINRLGNHTAELYVAVAYAFFAFYKKQDPITALKSVKKLKPSCSETQIAIGTSKAKEFLFRPSKKDVSELRQELYAWQAAAISSIGRDCMRKGYIRKFDRSG